MIRNIYKTPISSRTLDQQVTNEVGLRLFNRTFHGNGDRRTIKYHGRVYMQFLDQHSPFALHRKTIEDLRNDFLPKIARQRNMESCYSLQEVRRSFPLRDALLCVLAETEDLSWAVLINVEEGWILQAKQFTRGKQLSIDKVERLTEGTTILNDLVSQGIISEDGIIQPHYHEGFPSLGFTPSIELPPQDIGAILNLFTRAQWAKTHNHVSRQEIFAQIAGIVPHPQAKTLRGVIDSIKYLTGSDLGVPILDHSFYPERNHEQAWCVFPSISSATSRAISANQQVTRRTILTFRRFHQLLSEA